jgi:hypothetical protein
MTLALRRVNPARRNDACDAASRLRIERRNCLPFGAGFP